MFKKKYYPHYCENCSSYFWKTEIKKTCPLCESNNIKVGEDKKRKEKKMNLKIKIPESSNGYIIVERENGATLACFYPSITEEYQWVEDVLMYIATKEDKRCFLEERLIEKAELSRKGLLEKANEEKRKIIADLRAEKEENENDS